MRESEEKTKDATPKDGETSTNLALEGSMYSYDNNVINGFVLRAKIFDSVRKEDSSLQEPVIEVP